MGDEEKNQKKTYNKGMMRQAFPIIFFILMLVYSLSLLIPMLWTLLSSVKGRLDFYNNPFGLPKVWKFSNYSTAFNKLYVRIQTETGSRNVYMPEMLWNTLLYTLGGTIVTTMSHCFVAYACAKYNFRFGKFLYGFVIVALIMPIVGSLPSELQLIRAIGFYDNMFGIIIMKAGFLGTNFLIFYATFKGISWEYAEAALIDGASHWKVLFSIMIPLASTTVFVTGLLCFITMWNDYQSPMIYLPSYPTVAYGLFQYQFSTDAEINSVPMQLAGCTLAMFPIFVLFILFQDKLVGNLSIGGLKG